MAQPNQRYDRLVRRGGVKRISGLIYEKTRGDLLALKKAENDSPVTINLLQFTCQKLTNLRLDCSWSCRMTNACPNY